MTFSILAIVALLILGSSLSWQIEDKNREARIISYVIITLLVALLVGGTVSNYGVLGNPRTLDRNIYYKVLGVAQIGEKSTAVILRDGSGKTIPIKFVTQIIANTNGFYRLDGSSYESYGLVPIE